jgi:hypothetical protein
MLDLIIRFLFPMIILLLSWRIIWRNEAALRVHFFAWSTALGKILIMHNLRKQHIIVVEWCCMCKKNVESIDNFLFQCEIASAIWNTIFSSVGMVWVMFRRVVDFFACWRAPGGRFQLEAIWNMILPCLSGVYGGKDTIVALMTMRGP